MFLYACASVMDTEPPPLCQNSNSTAWFWFLGSGWSCCKESLVSGPGAEGRLKTVSSECFPWNRMWQQNSAASPSGLNHSSQLDECWVGKKASSPHLTCWFQALKMWTLPQVWLILKQKQMFALFEVHVEIGARAVYSKWEEFENSSCRGSLSNTPDHLNVRLIYCLATRSTSATVGNTIFQETWWCLIRASII